MKENQSRTGEFLNAEEIELLAELAMVALLRFLDLGQVLVEFLLREPGCAVDALQLLVLLVALPVGAGDRKQLERLDFRSVGEMRAAAEVDEVRAKRVLRKDIVGALFDELDLHRLIHLFVLLDAFRLGNQLTLVSQVFRLQFPHFGFDLLQILREWKRGFGRSKS